MIRVMFVCLGNICRSPMAECVMSDIVAKRGLQDKICVASSATSSEEIGNPIYPPVVRKLVEKHVPVLNHHARKLCAQDINCYDYFVGMEERNLVAMRRILAGDAPISRLLDFSSNPRDIADPWWTGNFDVTYDDIVEGCNALVEHIVATDLK